VFINFNSNMVWLKECAGVHAASVKVHFNSNMVWLKEKRRKKCFPSLLNFNSNMVWLKGIIDIVIAIHDLNFNSNMVWLKVLISYSKCVSLSFQFQYGLIKRQREHCRLKQLRHFNSNMVWLKARDRNNNRHGKYHFNSNMVWLKVNYEDFKPELVDISIPIWSD